MPNVISQIAAQLPQPTLPPAVHSAGETQRGLAEGDAYVGEVVRWDITAPFFRFTIPTDRRPAPFRHCDFFSLRGVNPQTTPDARVENSSVILLTPSADAGVPRLSGELNSGQLLPQIRGHQLAFGEIIKIELLVR